PAISVGTARIAAQAASLRAIAVIYGMNFSDMTELKTQYGYFVVLGVIATLCLVLFGFFRRRKWL
ncbi:CorA family divalent cation transporter, partial [Rhizobium ruizarguesonis]